MKVGDRLGRLSHCDTCDENEDSPEGIHTHTHQCSKLSRENTHEARRQQLSKRGSVMSDYLTNGSFSSPYVITYLVIFFHCTW